MDSRLVRSILEVEDRHWWFRARRQIILDLVERLVADGKKDMRILDVGAGSGFIAESLSRFGGVSALESDPQSLACIRERPGIEAIEGILPSPKLPKGSFDLVTCFDVLEHIEGDGAVLREIAGLLRPGGKVLLTVPAHPWLWTAHDDANHHVRRYRASELQERVQSAGLRILLFSAHLTLLFPLFLLERILSKLAPARPTEVAVTLPNSVVNKLLYWLYAVERFWLRRGWALPYGASYLALVEKPGHE